MFICHTTSIGDLSGDEQQSIPNNLFRLFVKQVLDDLN
jgi:hypothetical protein